MRELKFLITKENSHKAYLTLDNLSTGSVAYKVKTTAPRFYIVKPNQGILDKGSKITVDIQLFPAPVSPTSSHLLKGK